MTRRTNHNLFYHGEKMRITTFAKKFESAVKHRPRIETKHVEAFVTLTGSDYKPMIDLVLKNGDVVTELSLDVDEARQVATWIKDVTR
jgi:hypothetical protein